jgi:Protein of unknown function (DUF2815)
MTETTKPNTVAITPEGRLLFPYLFTPRAFQRPGAAAKGAPRFETSIMFPATAPEVVALKAAIMAAAQKEFPGRTDWKGMKWPIQDGNAKAAARAAIGKTGGEMYKGMLVLSAHALSQRAPEIIDRAGNPIIDSKAVYAGVYARLSVNFKGGKLGGDHVTCYLNHVLITKAGERIGGVSAANAFGGLVDGGDDNTVGASGTALDDTMPF